MTCPYCGKEMEEGYIKSSHFIGWISGKVDEKLSFDFTINNNSVFSGFFKGYHSCGHYCPQCKKIILSLK